MPTNKDCASIPALEPEDKPTAIYAFTRAWIRVGCAFLGGLTVTGSENIPSSGPVILAPNHRAHIDPPYIALITKRQVCFMAKRELFRGPLGWLMRKCGSFPVVRGAPDRAALRHAIELLKAGKVVVIFPEGTRSENGRLKAAEKGFSLIAKQTGATIVPVAIEGTEKMMPKGAKRIKRGHPQITVGRAIDPATLAGLKDKDALEKIGEGTMLAIAGLLGEDPAGLTNRPSAGKIDAL